MSCRWLKQVMWMPSSSQRKRLKLASTTPESGVVSLCHCVSGSFLGAPAGPPSTNPNSAKYRSRSAAPLGYGKRVIRTARSATALGSGTSWDMASQQWLTGLDTGTPTTVDLPVPARPALDVVARMVQPVNDVERVPTRRLEPCRRARRERDAGLGARRPTRARSSRAGS